MEQSKHQIISDWVNLHSNSLYRWVIYRVRNETLAEDLVQDTFLAAFQQFHSFRNDSAPQTWLHAILKNKLTDHFRKQARHAIINDHTLNEFFDDEGRWHGSTRPTPWDNEEHVLDNTDFQHVLLACLDQLPENWAACMKLRYLEEKKAEEVCQELDIKPTNYWQIIHRSKLRLRNCLQEHWFKNNR